MLQSMGLQRIRNDLVTEQQQQQIMVFLHWALPDGAMVKNSPAVQKMQVQSPGLEPIPALFPGKFHGQRNMVGYFLCCCTESYTTEFTHADTPTFLQ